MLIRFRTSFHLNFFSHSFPLLIHTSKQNKLVSFCKHVWVGYLMMNLLFSCCGLDRARFFNDKFISCESIQADLSLSARIPAPVYAFQQFTGAIFKNVLDCKRKIIVKKRLALIDLILICIIVIFCLIFQFLFNWKCLRVE